VDKGLALGLPTDDPSGAAARILQAIENRSSITTMAQGAEDFVRSEWTYRETTRHLREWALHPTLASDNRRWFFEDQLSLQAELGSLELALDYTFTGPERRTGNGYWWALRSLLAQRWPWPDGRKWWEAARLRDG
jgi:hypothetical protein